MEARLTPRRLLTCAGALVALAALATGCGGGTEAQAAAKQDPPPLLKYSAPNLSFTYPAAWTASAPKGPGELHFSPLVYLSTQPVRDACSVHGNETACDWPITHLQPGGVLGVWQVPYTAGLPFAARGRSIRVGDKPAFLLESAGGPACRRIGADTTVEVTVPSRSLELTVCLRGPGVSQNERRIRALLASVKFPPQ